MSRRVSQNFACDEFANLARQLLFSPADRRQEQVQRAEHLHDELAADRNYPFDFVSFRVTGYRTESKSQTIVPGDVLQSDLRLIIDQLSWSATIPVQKSESVESPEQIAERLNVSTKTVDRWRKKGLRWRWAQLPGQNQKQLVIPVTALRIFLARNKQQVERAARFTHLEPQLRQKIIDRARRIAQARNISLHLVSRHLARRVGRSIQTVRATLERHDRDHPGNEIFADRTKPLTDREKCIVCRAHRMGVPVPKICQRFKRSRSTIMRLVRKQRAAVIRDLPIAFVHSPTFDRDDADKVILRPEPTSSSSRARNVPVDDLPDVFQPLFRQPRLGGELSRSLLIRLSYLRYKAASLRDRLDRFEPRAGDMDRIEQYLNEALALRNRVVSSSLPLLLAVARRHVGSLADSSTTKTVLGHLLEASIPTLIEAVDTVDTARKQSFEAYLTWHLMRFYAQSSSTNSGRAHRREPPEVILQRIYDTTADRGITLPQ